MQRYLDLKYLQSLDIQPYWFGLGFVKLEIQPDIDLHFWSKNFPLTNTNEIHNHWRSFRSWILKGSIENKIYKIHPEQGQTYVHTVLEIDKPLKELSDAKLTLDSCLVYGQGCDYYMEKTILHDADFQDATITVLKYSGESRSSIDIFRKPNTAHAKPRIDYPVEQLWQEIQRIIEK